jgi:hypothetical protein
VHPAFAPRAGSVESRICPDAIEPKASIPVNKALAAAASHYWGENAGSPAFVNIAAICGLRFTAPKQFAVHGCAIKQTWIVP